MREKERERKSHRDKNAGDRAVLTAWQFLLRWRRRRRRRQKQRGAKWTRAHSCQGTGFCGNTSCWKINEDRALEMRRCCSENTVLWELFNGFDCCRLECILIECVGRMFVLSVAWRSNIKQSYSFVHSLCRRSMRCWWYLIICKNTSFYRSEKCSWICQVRE